jgi:prevent-host-death family protein
MAKLRQIGAGEFKARCLALLDEVAATGEEIVVTKRGEPVAKVVPFKETSPLEGSVVHEDDIVSPLDESWSVK